MYPIVFGQSPELDQLNIAIALFPHTESTSTVTISGPTQILNRIQAALREPHWQLYLGRRCCVPDRPVLDAADAI